jgi:hypothetical protein
METRPCRQPSHRSPPQSFLRIPTERREGAHRIQSAAFRTGVKEMGSSSFLVIQGQCSIIATSESRVTHSKILMNQWRNRASSRDQLGHQLAFTKTDDEPGNVGEVCRELVYRQHAQFVQDYQFWGHWVHKRTDAQGRIYHLSPEVILGNARGRVVEPSRLRRVFRLRQLTRQVRQQGQIRLHNFGLYVDHGLSGQTVEVLIYDEAMRIEQAEHLLVAYPCVYNTRQRRITAVDGTGRQQYHPPMLQLMLWTLKLARTVWHMPRYGQGPWLSRPLSAPQMGLFD